MIGKLRRNCLAAGRFLFKKYFLRQVMTSYCALLHTNKIQLFYPLLLRYDYIRIL